MKHSKTKINKHKTKNQKGKKVKEGISIKRKQFIKITSLLLIMAFLILPVYAFYKIERPPEILIFRTTSEPLSNENVSKSIFKEFIFAKPNGALEVTQYYQLHNLTWQKNQVNMNYSISELIHANVTYLHYGTCQAGWPDKYDANFTNKCELIDLPVGNQNYFGIIYDLSFPNKRGDIWYIQFEITPTRKSNWLDTRRSFIVKSQIDNEIIGGAFFREIILDNKATLQEYNGYSEVGNYPNIHAKSYNYQDVSFKGVNVLETNYYFPQRESILIPSFLAMMVSFITGLVMLKFNKVAGWIYDNVIRRFPR